MANSFLRLRNSGVIAFLVIEPAMIARIKEAMPVLPRTMAETFVRQFGLPEYDATTLTQSQPSKDSYICLEPRVSCISSGIGIRVKTRIHGAITNSQ